MQIVQSDGSTHPPGSSWRLCLAAATAAVFLSASPRTADAGALSVLTHQFPPTFKLAIVWFDHRVHGPPDLNAPIAIVPQYQPGVPYDPNSMYSSPLEPPTHKGGQAYLGDKIYDGHSFAAEFGPDRELTDPADTVGYGRAFNLPSRLPPTGGNAPPLLMNVSTEARPPDAEAIAARGAVSSPIAFAAGSSPAGAPATAPSHGAGTGGNSPNSPRTQPTSQPTLAMMSSAPLAAAFVKEDARHARSSLPVLLPPK